MSTEHELLPGLYLVSTPLGNLGDLSERAREVLSRASFVAGETSQSVLKWFQLLELGEKKPGLLSYRESSKDKDGAKILGLIGEGHSVALISDAGTPGISDPGWQLVAQAQDRGLSVWPVPGPCAAIGALSVSGFPSRYFWFEGFLPQSGRARKDALQRLDESAAPCVLYESPHRFLQTLQDLFSVRPDREIFVSREMTKKFEESWRGTLSRAVEEWPNKMIKGEFTLVLGPRQLEEETGQGVSQETIDLARELGIPTKSAARFLKHLFPQESKKELYRRLSE